MCADVLVYNLDQWRSSDSSTDVNITIFNFKEGQLTLLTHVLHRAPSASSETCRSGRCSFLFRRAARRRDCVQDARLALSSNMTSHVKTRSESIIRRPHGGARAAERVRER